MNEMTLGGLEVPTVEQLVIAISEDVNILTFNKKELVSKAKETANSAIDTGFDLEMYVYAKKLAEFSKNIIEGLKPHLDGKPIYNNNLYNCEIIEKMQGTKYDFSDCNDTVWNDLKAQMDDLKAKISEREKFLKCFSKITCVINEESGEVMEINPPVKTGKLGVEVTIK